MSLSQQLPAPSGTAQISPLMHHAFAALGGEKVWEGRVRGLAGLIRRTFNIQSMGVLEDGRLIFSETLTFNDGVTSKRQWEIREQADGLCIKSDSVTLLKPGRFEAGELVFDYRLRLGRFALPYRDRFRICASGDVENTGYVTLLGIKIMTISVMGRAVT